MIGEYNSIREALNNLGSIKKYNELIVIALRGSDSIYLSIAYSGIAASYLKLGNLDLALTFVSKARNIISEKKIVLRLE